MRPTGPCPGPSTVPPRGPGPLWGAIRVPLISFPDAAAPATCSVPCRRGDTCRGRLRTLRNTFQGTFSSGTSRWEGGRRGCKGGAESPGAGRSGQVRPTPHSDAPGCPRVLLLARHAPRISPGLQPSRLPGSSGLRRVLLFRLMLAVWGCRAGVRWRVPWPGFVRRPSRG